METAGSIEEIGFARCAARRTHQRIWAVMAATDRGRIREEKVEP
jgi:hypothetical protein